MQFNSYKVCVSLSKEYKRLDDIRKIRNKLPLKLGFSKKIENILTGRQSFDLDESVDVRL